MTDETDTELADAIDELRSEDTRTWAVVAGKPDDTSAVYISPVDDPQGLDLQPPYTSFAAALVAEAATESGASREEVMRAVVAQLNKI